MCIIAIKPKNKKLQDKTVLKTCFERNPDGAGYMFVHDNQVIIKKGFMQFDDFYKAVVEDYDNFHLEAQNLVMHFRIGTSGQNKLGCTHPFPITNDMDMLNSTRVSSNIGVVHNGIISPYNDRNTKYSDTQLYIAKVLTPVIKLNLRAYSFPDIQNMILDTTKSKLAFLDKLDDVYTVGDFITDDGYKYSNSTYRPIVNTYYPSYFSYGAYDYYEDDRPLKEYLNSAARQKMLNSKKATKPSMSYKALKAGNVIICNELEYLEVPSASSYFFDSKYNIYTLHDKKLIKVGTNATIYQNDAFTHRIGW